MGACARRAPRGMVWGRRDRLANDTHATLEAHLGVTQSRKHFIAFLLLHLLQAQQIEAKHAAAAADARAEAATAAALAESRAAEAAAAHEQALEQLKQTEVHGCVVVCNRESVSLCVCFGVVRAWFGAEHASWCECGSDTQTTHVNKTHCVTRALTPTHKHLFIPTGCPAGGSGFCCCTQVSQG